MKPADKEFRQSVVTLRDKIEHLNQCKTDVSSELKLVEDQVDPQILFPELISLKEVERQQSESESRRAAHCLKLQTRIDELQKLLQDVYETAPVNKRIDQAKQGLSIKRTTVLMLKRQLDEIPSQGELNQYDRRLSELYTLIQGKLRQTRQCYATYNALLEMKDLMLKETSLLNSISGQLHNAISSSSGQAQLLSSMQGILLGSQQKLKKIQLDLQVGQKVHENLKDKYAATMSEQRLCKSLLQAFQAECAKNEQLQSLAP